MKCLGSVICDPGGVNWFSNLLSCTTAKERWLTRGDYWENYKYCDSIAIVHMAIAMVLRYYCDSIAIVLKSSFLLNFFYF